MFAAAEVRPAGWGGLKAAARITGLARSTINRGEDDLDGEPLPEGQVRRKGGGRKQVAVTDAGLVPALKCLVEPVTRGDPVRPLTWVSKSMDKLATALIAMGQSGQRRHGAFRADQAWFLTSTQPQGGRGRETP